MTTQFATRSEWQMEHDPRRCACGHHATHIVQFIDADGDVAYGQSRFICGDEIERFL